MAMRLKITPANLALYQILEQAKINFDFSSSELDKKAFWKIVTLASDALGKPSLAQLQKFKKHLDDLEEGQKWQDSLPKTDTLPPGTL
jgi:hypothetical protein